MYIDKDFKSKKVIEFVKDLIATYHYEDINDLSDEDKLQFVSFLNEAGGRLDEFSCITDVAHSDMAINAFRKMLCGNRKDADNFLLVIQSNAVDYYESIMQGIFEETYSEYMNLKQDFINEYRGVA